jgi:trehalose synthase
MYREIGAEASAHPEIHLRTNLTGVGNVEVNALQRLSDVTVQNRFAKASGS